MSLSGLLLPSRARAVAVDGAFIEPPVLEPTPAWSLPAVAVAAALWGHGLVAPFTVARAEALVEASGLCAADRVLLIGGGPGGAERLLSGLTGAEFHPYDADPLLALLGGARSFAAGSPDFGRQGFDIAIVLDLPETSVCQDMMAAIARSLRPGGRMVIDACVPDLKRLPVVLRHLRCVIETADDGSADHISDVITAWARLAGQLGRHGGTSFLHAEARRALLREAERWMPKLARLRQGALHHVRVVGAITGRASAQHPASLP
jgi:SAM-dependent methyltransferase